MMRLGIGVGVGRQRFAGGFADSYSSRVLADGGTIESLSCVANASTLLQQASLLFIPSGYKAGVAYSALPNNGNGDLTWTRNSTANRTQSNGNIGSVGANVPRLSYMYGSCPSALLEPQRTNLLLQSETIDNASWTKINATITSNSTTSPDGNNTADKLVENTSNASHSILQSVTINTSTSYNISVYLKSAERFRFRIRFTVFNGSTDAFINLNLGTTTTGTLTNIGNGWFRFDWTLNSSTGASSPSVAVTLVDSAGNATYLGDGTSGAFVWGLQLEQGSYATTYIPTTTASATRIADTFTRNNIYTNGVISASGGTWFVEFRNNVSYTRDTSVAGLTLTDGATNSIAISCVGTGRLRVGKFTGAGYAQLFLTTTDIVKLAIKWNGIGIDIFSNGVKVVTNSSYTTTLMQILNHSITVDVPKFIQQMALFNTPLSDSDCQLLTT